MANFLAIETATDVCSVAMLMNGNVAIEMALGKSRAHSENLVPMIKEVLSYTGLHVDQLAGIVISKGPGSYTGLRIGVSAAKGLAFSHKIPLISVSSLEALATATRPLLPANCVIAPSFKSRKNEVYLGIYSTGEESEISELAPVISLHRDEIPAYLAQWPVDKLHLVGEGSTLVSEVLVDNTNGSTDPANNNDDDRTKPALSLHSVSPTASTVATLGAARHKNGLIDDLGSFEPFYLKEFIPKAQKKSIFERLPF